MRLLMGEQERLQKLVKIESDISELKSESQGYQARISKLREAFPKESYDLSKATEIAQELSFVSQKQRMIDIKIDLLEQAKKKIVSV